MEQLRADVVGEGNLNRFDYWLNTFQYHRSLSKLSSYISELDRAMKEVGNNKTDIQNNIIPLRIKVTKAWNETMTELLETFDTPGDMGVIANLEQRTLRHAKLITGHDMKIEETLGAKLPEETKLSMKYSGAKRLVVPTRLSVIKKGEDLKVKAILLGIKPVQANVYFRPLGNGKFQAKPLAHEARAVYFAYLPAASEDYEYYIEVVDKNGEVFNYPPTAGNINHVVVAK
jgi:hypothetical protein